MNQLGLQIIDMQKERFIRLKVLIKNNGVFLAKFFAVAILLAVATLSKAQYQANNWYFGNGAGLNFNFNPPAVLENGNAGLGTPSNMEGVGSMSDVSGNLLFYTNGISVFNKNHVAMPAGTGLLGGDGSATQSGLSLQVNGSTTQYFIISNDNATNKSYYSIVDMAAATGGGLGDVTTKNSPLLASNCSEGVVAIPVYDALNNPTGENWIIFHDYNSNNFRVYKTSTNTISYVTNYALGTNPAQKALIMKTNGCFTKIALTTHTPLGEVDIFPFNNITGVISAPTLILSFAGGAFLSDRTYGVEFSPNDQFLYVTNSGINGAKTVYQFDITLGTGTNPAAVIASKSSFTGDASVDRFGHLQLGPDGKIYCPGYITTSPNYISVIPTPDVAWTRPTPTASEFQYKQYTFYSKRVGEGLPVFSQDLLRQLRIYYNTACEGGSTNFSYSFGGKAVSQSWNFGDPSSGVLNTSNAVSPSHTYNTAGTYTVTLSVVDNCGRTRTASINVIIKPGPQVTVPGGACPNTNVVLTGTGVNKANYMWYNDAATTSLLGGPSATYTYNGALPKTIYVKDPTPLAIYTTGNTTAAADAKSDSGDTRFELYTTAKLLSFQAIGKTPGTGGTISLYKWNGVGWTLTSGTEAWSQAYPATVNGTVYTFSPNVTLSPGKYRIRATDLESFFKNNTSMDGGNGVVGVINIFGDTDTAPATPKGGPYLNLKLELPDPCGVRAITIANTCGLPVDWISFTGKTVENSIHLNWQVSNERNNSHFVIQRSDDGNVFNDLAVVKAEGNTKSASAYNYYDLSPENINYYRIIQVDLDGKTSTSNVIYISLTEKDIIASPNPFNRELNLTFSFAEGAKVDVFDLSGKLIESLNKANGEYVTSLGNSYNKGVYIVRIYFNEYVKSLLIIKE